MHVLGYIFLSVVISVVVGGLYGLVEDAFRRR